MSALLRCYLYLGLLTLPLLAHADTDIAGLKIPAHYELDGESLTLNGAGIRSKLFVKVYVGALYLRNTTHDAHQAIQAAGPKSMQMYMLYKEVDANKITRGWDEGISNNLSQETQSAIADRQKSFNALFTDLKAGDHVRIDFRPGKGTTLTINDRALGTVEGADFFRALLTVWLGPEPADDDLKEGLLGE